MNRRAAPRRSSTWVRHTGRRYGVGVSLRPSRCPSSRRTTISTLPSWANGPIVTSSRVTASSHRPVVGGARAGSKSQQTTSPTGVRVATQTRPWWTITAGRLLGSTSSSSVNVQVGSRSAPVAVPICSRRRAPTTKSSKIGPAATSAGPPGAELRLNGTIARQSVHPAWSWVSVWRMYNSWPSSRWATTTSMSRPSGSTHWPPSGRHPAWPCRGSTPWTNPTRPGRLPSSGRGGRRRPTSLYRTPRDARLGGRRPRRVVARDGSVPAPDSP